jgi:ubiquinone/menaquinone biosynthesis C-methylase UbiE
MTVEAHKHFLPAMGAHGPLALYDPFTRLLGARRLHERLIDQARIRPDDRVLDVGCGTGNLTLLVAKRYPTASVVGLDPDPAALERARKKAAKGKLTAAFDQGFAEELPYPDKSVDVVLCSLALHHVTEEHRITSLREIARVLRPGGTFHLLEMAKNDPARPVNRLVHRSPHGHTWGELDMVAMLKNAGLTDPVDLGRASKLLGTFAFYLAGSDQ